MKRHTSEEQKVFDETWSVTYAYRERDSCKDVRNVQMSWENRTPEEIMENLNAFLVSTRTPLRVISSE
jgi:hypothetical protein